MNNNDVSFDYHRPFKQESQISKCCSNQCKLKMNNVLMDLGKTKTFGLGTSYFLRISALLYPGSKTY